MERRLAYSFAERDIRGARPACKADFSTASLLTCATEDKCEAVASRGSSHCIARFLQRSMSRRLPLPAIERGPTIQCSAMSPV
jgi:hypothetical protein